MHNSSSTNHNSLYKAKNLKVYCNTEALYLNKKKYRKVFFQQELRYVYTEFSFINKLFELEEWTLFLTLKCYKVFSNGKRKELCALDIQKVVNPSEHIVFVREGWGSKRKNAFWKEGTYYWCVEIDGQEIIKEYFYIQNFDYIEPEESEILLDIVNVKMFEGGFKDKETTKRKYLEVFNVRKTRYIYLDLHFKNNYIYDEWKAELFIRFFNESKDLKAEIVKLINIDEGQVEIPLSVGWGNTKAGSWGKGEYSVEVILFETKLCSIIFEIGDEARKGTPKVLNNSEHEISGFLGKSDHQNQSFDEIFEEINELIGLENVKGQLLEMANYAKFIQYRKSRGFDEDDKPNLHTIFLGNPGTGKTTLALYLGKLFKSIGLLSKGHIHEVDRVALIGEYIGQTAPKVKDAIEKARGGVLFIDEAYALARRNDDNKDFGKEVIEILIKEMSNGPGDIVIVGAGYPEEMKSFLNSNPGLKSRFKYVMEFEDYLPPELLDIAIYSAKKKDVKFTASAMAILKTYVVRQFRNRDKYFGNARFINNLVENSKQQMGLRLIEEGNLNDFNKKKLSTILVEDVKNALKLTQKRSLKFMPIDYQDLNNYMSQLEELIGLERLKKQIEDLVQIIQYKIELEEKILEEFDFHMTLIGNPGTGKTTVARLLSKILSALGVVERGHLVETDRQGLVAGYVGQTALKTNAKINSAIGGALFIDEAYALSQNVQSNDFGDEAIQTIIKRMEDDRGRFFVMLAGYPDKMNNFIESNPGLRSRINYHFYFEDFSAEEMIAIVMQMFKQKGYQLRHVNASKFLREWLQDAVDEGLTKNSNGRYARKIVEKTIMAQNIRKNKAKTSSKNKIVVLTDLIQAKKTIEKFDDLNFQRKVIGFK